MCCDPQGLELPRWVAFCCYQSCLIPLYWAGVIILCVPGHGQVWAVLPQMDLCKTLEVQTLLTVLSKSS